MKKKQYLFVYGTLRRVFGNRMFYRFLEKADFIDCATVQGKLFHTGNYPGAVSSENPSERVSGEVYLLHDPKGILKELDEYEGCGPADPQPNEYKREERAVRLMSGRKINAWVYMYALPTDRLRLIPSGDYANDLEKSRE